MFFQRVSEEVSELGKEIIAYYSDVEMIDSRDNNGGYTLFTFRSQDVFRKHEKRGIILCGDFSELNSKETKYLLQCFTKASLKKLTYANNKD